MKEGWEIKKIGDVCSVAAGQGAPQGDANYCVKGTPFIKAGNLEDLVNGLSEHDVQNVSDEVAKQHRLKLYKQGSVVFAKSGMSCMKGYVYSLKTDCYVVSHLAILTPFGISTSFLRYLLELHRPNSLVKDAAYPSISLEDIKSFRIPVPPFSEQERIVAELDCLSGVIEKQKQQLKELDNLAQAIFYDMFGEEVAKTQEWATCTVGDVYKFQYGKGNKIPESKGEYPCYGSNGQVGYHTEYNGEDSPIIGHIGAYAGIVNWARGKHFVTYNGVICNLKNKEFDPIYAFYMLKAQDYMSKARGGAAQPFVSYDMLEEPIIFIPPLSLQQEFASKIEAIEKQKELIKQSLSETETLFNSRMDYYFN